MIIQISVIVLVVLAVRSWVRRRRAERDMARRIVSRGLMTFTVHNAADQALTREAARAARDRADATRAARYWEEIERNRRLNEWRFA